MIYNPKDAIYLWRNSIKRTNLLPTAGIRQLKKVKTESDLAPKKMSYHGRKMKSFKNIAGNCRCQSDPFTMTIYLQPHQSYTEAWNRKELRLCVGCQMALWRGWRGTNGIWNPYDRPTRQEPNNLSTHPEWLGITDLYRSPWWNLK